MKTKQPMHQNDKVIKNEISTNERQWKSKYRLSVRKNKE